jgi:hypothetical protein
MRRFLHLQRLLYLYVCIFKSNLLYFISLPFPNKNSCTLEVTWQYMLWKYSRTFIMPRIYEKRHDCLALGSKYSTWLKQICPPQDTKLVQLNPMHTTKTHFISLGFILILPSNLHHVLQDISAPKFCTHFLFPLASHQKHAQTGTIS